MKYILETYTSNGKLIGNKIDITEEEYIKLWHSSSASIYAVINNNITTYHFINNKARKISNRYTILKLYLKQICRKVSIL